ncbi:hypothetical protein glysoja_049195 [Glycine soja]|uniref:Clp R domain-containing protein n=1 Tax=Glycine soja TaxID=3848 RepID=A0A0B2QDT6_GLYSO|nr:hypothetical protein glysoja_049195 [Glycine soja]
MRRGICSIQLQPLTPEATTVVKQAVNLATRRGHAQVIPLHVASAMLATSTGLLRKACLQCHSHPLQCKALELYFNVALNHLLASTSSPLLAPQYSTPSLCNALFVHKRLLLIGAMSKKISPSPIMLFLVVVIMCLHHLDLLVKLLIGSFTKPNLDHVNNDDVTSVLSELVRRKNTVIVGEGVANAEGVAREVMERFEVGNVPGDLRYVQFVSLPLMCFRNISKEEVEQKLMVIRNLMKSYVGRGVILYLGDLKCDFQAQERSKVFFKDVAFEDRTGVRNHLTCCRDCLINFEKEAQSITNCISKKVCTASSLPMWLQNCKEERSDIMEDQENSRLEYLCKKWNCLCNSIHRRHPSIMEFCYRPV